MAHIAKAHKEINPSAEITVSLPLPPSTNALYVVAGRRRIKSRAYRSWLRDAGWIIRSQHPRGRLHGPWEAHVRLPEAMRGDCDNRLKPILDALVRSGLVADDRYCTGASVKRDGTVHEAIVTVRSPS